MLDEAEQIKAAEKFVIKKPSERTRQHISDLPDPLRPLAYRILDRDANGKRVEFSDHKRYQDFVNRQPEAFSQLSQLSAEQRVLIIQCFCPSLASELEQAYQLHKTLPQKPFYSGSLRYQPNPESSSVQHSAGQWLFRFLRQVHKVRPEIVDAEWLVTWGSRMWVLAGIALADCDPILTVVLNDDGERGDRLFALLESIVKGEVESSLSEIRYDLLNDYVISALLMANRPEGWQLIADLLIAAQRQEGLRTSILDALHGAHPQAYTQLLGLITDHRLIRFSSVSHCMVASLGFGENAIKPKSLQSMLEFVRKGLADTADAVFSTSDPETCYLTLVAIGQHDLARARKHALDLAAKDHPDLRFAGLYYLSQLSDKTSSIRVASAMADPDERLQAFALMAIGQYDYDPAWSPDLPVGDEIAEDVYPALVALLAKAAKINRTITLPVWSWMEVKFRKEHVGGALIASIGPRPVTVLIRHLNDLNPVQRGKVYELLSRERPWSDEIRKAIVAGVGDKSTAVSETCVDALRKKSLTEAELISVESLLSRKASEFRHQVFRLILRHKDEVVFDSAQRLLGNTTVPHRHAGIEILRRMTENKRSVERCRAIIEQWASSTHTRISKDQQSQIDSILTSVEQPGMNEVALGLLKFHDWKTPPKPEPPGITLFTDAAVQLYLEIERLFDEQAEYELEDPITEEQTILGNILLQAPRVDQPLDAQLADLPLAKFWQEWLSARPDNTRDKDGFEWIRAFAFALYTAPWGSQNTQKWAAQSEDRQSALALPAAADQFVGSKHDDNIIALLQWLHALDTPTDRNEVETDFGLDVLALMFSLVTDADVEKLTTKKVRENPYRHDWREDYTFVNQWHALVATQPRLTEQQKGRRYQLLAWFDRPHKDSRRMGMSACLQIEGFAAGCVSPDSLIYHLLDRDEREYGAGYSLLGSLTSPCNAEFRAAAGSHWPEIGRLLDQCRQRIMEIELLRGEAETIATDAAMSLRSIYGVDQLIRLLTALGKDDFKHQGYYYQEAVDRRNAFTHLIAICFPATNDTPLAAANQLKEVIRVTGIPEERLLQLGFLAPQWLPTLDAYFGWQGFKEAYYWFFAHMKYLWEGVPNAALDHDDNAPLAEEGESQWRKIVQQRTDLSEEDRLAGVVDIRWFKQTRDQLDDEQWHAVAKAARFASSPAQAKQATYIAEVLTGKADRTALINGIKGRKLKENVRLLGLLPLKSQGDAQKDILERYEILQDYRQYANQLSGLTKPDALRAIDIGFENLARTAGYQDPLRLTWALEANQNQDLAAGHTEVIKGDVSVRLDISQGIEPRLLIERDGRSLKNLPVSCRKDKTFIAMRERAKTLKKQRTRSRLSLETAMNTRAVFSGRELQALSGNAVLWPLLSRLVFITEDCGGYLDRKGKKLHDFSGETHAVRVKDSLRIAHPADLLASGTWKQWQSECFNANRVQPFKQLFRELYLVTAQERKDKVRSRRYAGQQVNPRQAMALWGGRGWHTDDTAWKSFPAQKLTVSVNFDDVAGCLGDSHALTLDTITFHQSDSDKLLLLSDIDPVLYSEVMRDIDLVVSVAHLGAVDPEASASTVEIRSRLLQHTFDIVGLDNIKIKKNHAIIEGVVGRYSLHLGSGEVHRLPGQHLCMVPVHSQHRGRLFLPFADDDPKTAEILSKALLLARDKDIQDPAILEQLRYG